MHWAANGDAYPERSGHRDLDYQLELTPLDVPVAVIKELGRQVPPDDVVLGAGVARRSGVDGVAVLSNTALSFSDNWESWSVPYTDMDLFDQAEVSGEWSVIFTAHGRVEQVTLLDRRSVTLRQAVDYVLRRRGVLASRRVDPPADDAPQG